VANGKAVLAVVAAVVLVILAVVVVRRGSDDPPSAAGGETPAADGTTGTGPGSEADPLALGTAATVADWEVKVLGVEPDGSAKVALAGGPTAEPGNAFVIVHLWMRNAGTDEASIGDVATVGYQGSDDRSYDDELVALPSALSDMAPIVPGDETEGTVVLEVPVTAIANGRVFVESSLSLSSERTWWQQRDAPPRR
jgi:hypothetical protein